MIVTFACSAGAYALSSHARTWGSFSLRMYSFCSLAREQYEHQLFGMHVHPDAHLFSHLCVIGKYPVSACKAETATSSLL